ncbi:hypothetical protein CAPTEDRAFT_207880 [Capitella teleta]|uniref:Uncharacterized protein n=1 Tax=Capitella teleta TaxID=283909 RepID=R7UCU2_CAPTE|nr:hypothetical protein CAPTEDRAFT_207880 [Capitella teleta]|eukprot:ELU04205.1 hypothetical protein CAPTEDRAFT_207880 [Capitella teleta]
MEFVLGERDKGEGSVCCESVGGGWAGCDSGESVFDEDKGGVKVAKEDRPWLLDRSLFGPSEEPCPQSWFLSARSLSSVLITTIAIMPGHSPFIRQGVLTKNAFNKYAPFAFVAVTFTAGVWMDRQHVAASNSFCNKSMLFGGRQIKEGEKTWI